MLRPNYAMDAPPTTVTVGGADYNVATDYRVWLEIMPLLREIRANARSDSPQAMERLAKNIEQAEELAFGGILADEDPADAVAAMAQFAAGYPSAPIKGGEGERVYSFEYDLNEIIIAIWNQHGVDLSWRRKEPLHWWEFLLLFHTLSGEHYILNLMETRGYKGKDRDMLRRKHAAALPEEYTQEEKEEMEAFNRLFDADSAEDDG